MGASRIIFRQLFDRVSCTYTYILGDIGTRHSVLIDPVLELVERDITLLKEIGLKLRYVINTHVHADHITGSGEIKKRLNANVASNGGERVLSAIAEATNANADVHLSEDDVINCGDTIKLKVLATPGHTSGCVSLVDHDNAMVFTGDTLLIRGCGRTDFQCGNSAQLYDSVQQKLFTLPDHYTVYPAHDYKGQLSSTIYEEKRFNPRLSKSKDDFIEIMANLKLDLPKMIDIAVPKNMLCGIHG